MMFWLKQSTAASVKVGPFVDSTDGVTAETGLTVAQASIRLSKNGGDYAQSNNDAGATHDENGYYDVPLDTTDTGTLGRLKLAISVAGALPCWAEFMVLPGNIYDSLVLGTDYIQTDAVQISGDDTAATATQVEELYKIAGLALGSPMTVTTAGRSAGGVSLTFTGDGVTTTTVTRNA